MVTLLIVSILLVALYVGATIWKRKELPESVSAMVYDLPKQGQWLWTVWIWSVGFSSFPIVFEAMPEKWEAVAHAFATSLVFVGAMPVVRGKRNTAHNILGVSAGIFSQVLVLRVCPWWLLVWMPMAVLMLMCSVRISGNSCIPSILEGKGIFIAEDLCGLSYYGSLFTYLICHG